ncbi:MAG: hypothetical protein U9Q83_09650, partial [Bacteroidota bacterium]|nr:hypothetical protein [Bacteroidota bacterium]
FIRLHAAGIEGENLLIRELQKRSFFYNQQLPYFSFELLWTTNSFYYVWICHTQEAETITNDVNEQDADNLRIRDFTGLDFTAWVYDLFKPNQNYEQRGTHPSGIGIDRYIKPSDLTTDELSYLKKQAYLQLINFASPMLLNINHIPVSIKGLKLNMNFAFRHYLTSFGNDISFDLLVKYNKLNLYNVFHFYSNGVKTFPGFETNIIDYDINLGEGKLKTSARTIIWMQPENLFFQDAHGTLGGLFEMTFKYGKKNFFPYLQMGGKTQGWVAGNEFQNSNAFLRFGLSWYFE